MNTFPQQQPYMLTTAPVEGVELFRPSFLMSSADAPEEEEPGGASPELEDAARKEQEYLRERLRDELKREPTEEELREWLRQHTEGY